MKRTLGCAAFADAEDTGMGVGVGRGKGTVAGGWGTSAGRGAAAEHKFHVSEIDSPIASPFIELLQQSLPFAGTALISAAGLAVST